MATSTSAALAAFPNSLRRLKKALESDDNDYVTQLENFTESFDPGKHASVINKNAQLIKKSKVLDLILDRVLPASFSELFLSSLRILAVLGTYCSFRPGCSSHRGS